MFAGAIVNTTEKRSVLHVALRANRKDKIEVSGINVVENVWSVLDQIKAFSEKVRRYKLCVFFFWIVHKSVF